MADLPSAGELITETIRSLRAAQRRLDWQAEADSQLAYAIPRVSVESSLGSALQPGGWAGFTRRNTGRSTLSCLRFTVVATPEAPREWQTASSLQLQIPAFLATPKELAVIGRKVIEGLRTFENDLYDRETEELETSLRSMSAGDTDRNGLFALRLDNEGQRFFVGRVGGRRDGIFVLTNSQLRVHSHYDDEGDASLLSAPFDQVFERIRRCGDVGLMRTVGSDAGIQLRLGNLPVAEAAVSLGQASSEAQSELASQDDVVMNALPSRYALARAGADLSYQVKRGSQKPRSQTPLLQSKARVDLIPGEPTEVRIALTNPEFVVPGASKSAFLDLLDRNREALLGDMAPSGNRARLRRALSDEPRRAGALVFAADPTGFTGRQFLVYWPAAENGSPTERFVFTVSYDASQDALTYARIVIAAGATDLTYENGPGGIRDFLKAILAWYQLTR